MSDIARQRLAILLMLLILMCASALRFYHLGTQSLWYDEGVTASHSQRSLGDLTPRLQNNVHVPAYFGTLALYENVVGHSEFALRSYSVWWSLLAIAAAYALGKRLYHPLVGVTAALLITLNTFNIYYAQEARMYSMLAALATLSLWVFVGWGRLAFQSENLSRLMKWALGFALLNLIGMYTHVTYALVMLTQGILASILLLHLAYDSLTQHRDPKSVGYALLTYTIANALTLIAFLPWLLVAVSQVSAQPNISDPLPIGQLLRTIQGWLAFGMTFEQGLGGAGAIIYFLLIFGVLLITDKRPQAAWRMLIPLVWVGVSVGAYVYLGLYTRYLRFLLPAQIAVALWLGRGLWVIAHIVPRQVASAADWRKHARHTFPKLVAGIALLALTWQMMVLLPPLYHDLSYQRDDYRAMLTEIESQAHPDDAIILSAPGLQEIVGYYHNRTIPMYTLPDSPDIAADTRAIIAQHPRLYVILFGQAEQDPDGIVEATLNRAAYPVDSQWVGDVRLERFVSPLTLGRVQAVSVQFGEAITLVSAAFSPTRLAPDDVIQVRLTWQTAQTLMTRYKIFLQLLNDEGVLVAQRDSEPVGGQAPTTSWQIGEPVIDSHALILNDLPAGDYTLIIGLYQQDNPQVRLPRADEEAADYYILTTIQVIE